MTNSRLKKPTAPGVDCYQAATERSTSHRETVELCLNPLAMQMVCKKFFVIPAQLVFHALVKLLRIQQDVRR